MTEFSLSSKYFTNISSFSNSSPMYKDHEFTIIINNSFRIKIPTAVAVAISDKITQRLKLDPDTTEFHVSIPSVKDIRKTLEKIKCVVASCAKVSIDDEERKIFAQFGVSIGNTDFSDPFLDDLKKESESLNVENVTQVITNKIIFENDDISKEIDYIAENFDEMCEEDSFIKFANSIDNLDIVERILNNKKLLISDEDSILEFIMSLCKANDNNPSLFRLFEYVYLEYCSTEMCKEFVDFVIDLEPEKNFRSIITCFSRRIVQPNIPMEPNFVNGRHEKKEKVYNFPYTGEVQEVSLCPGKYRFEVWGAGVPNPGNFNGYEPSKGGYSVGEIKLKKKKNLYVYVGQQGTSSNNLNENEWHEINGGWNGGGGTRSYIRSYHQVASGGGATDICLVKSEMKLNSKYLAYERTQESYKSRIIVAGAGGGFGYVSEGKGYSGGGESGGGDTSKSEGRTIKEDHVYPCGPGTQTHGGNLYIYPGELDQSTTDNRSRPGQFGIGGTYYSTRNSNTAAGGGGGGYYGGGCGNHEGGGGGSGFLLTKEKTKEDVFLTNGKLYGGEDSFMSPDGIKETGHPGNGFARITRI